MRKYTIAIVSALGALIAGVLASVLVTFATWYLMSWNYLHSPPTSPSDPHDAAAYVLMSLEMFIGLPIGGVAGLVGAAIVFKRILRKDK